MKRIASIQDFSCIGSCSQTIALPVLSAMGVECAALPTALLSALTDRPVRHDVAMTGEVTLRGRVMPIGGLREKTMGALRAGIRTVILPKENEKDLDEIDPNVRAKLRFVPVETVDAVFAEALVYPAAAPAARLATVLPGAAEGGKLPALRV